MKFIEGLERRRLLASVPLGFSDARVTGGIVQGTAMALAPDGRLFVAEQKGSIRVIKNGALLATNFVNLNTRIEGSRGLIGIAIDPSFTSNKHLYVYYTVFGSTVKNRLSRLTANGDVFQAGSEKVLWESPILPNANHNGGAIEFGKDGKLYLATGDGFISGNAQSLNSTMGKILRLNKDGTIPGDNPYYFTASGTNRAIWASGLRNPYTFAIHRGSGKMFINDVGDAAFEEVNEGRKGANYGWDTFEGPANTPGLTDPYYYYDHTIGSSVIASAFYSPANIKFPSAYKDDYFFGDYVAGFIKSMDYSGSAPVVSPFATGITQLVDIEITPDGSLYYLQRGNSRGTGAVSRITYVGAAAKPVITENPTDHTVAAGRPVTFEVSASGTAPLMYQWQRNGIDLPGATLPSYTIENAALSDDGAKFHCVVTNAAGSATSSAATLTVRDDKPPVPVIESPDLLLKYRGGMQVTYSGSATDPEDGTLDASRFEWEVALHHDTHTHPFFGPSRGSASGTFVMPIADEADTNQWYRIYLTVTDSIGNQTTVFRDIHPDVTPISLASNITGISLQLDGDVTTPGNGYDSLIGGQRKLTAPLEQLVGEEIYDFVGWSDGGSATHDIIIPEVPTTYTATYKLRVRNIDATYFDAANLTGKQVSRREGDIRFQWQYGSPDPAISPDTWSARFTSRLVGPVNGPVSFYASTDDGVRLWIDGQLIINRWVNQSQKESTGVFAMQAGKSYSFRMEYYDNAGRATAELFWSAQDLQRAHVPATAFVRDGSPGEPNSTQTTLSATADAMVRGGTHANINFGGSLTVDVKSDHPKVTDFQREGLFRFDITGIAQNVTLAKLRLNGRLNSSENSEVAVEVFEVMDGWSEQSVTWNTRPAAGISLGQVRVVGMSSAWYELDITQLVRNLKTAGKSRVNLMLRGVLPTKSRAIFASRETGTSGAQLEVTTG